MNYRVMFFAPLLGIGLAGCPSGSDGDTDGATDTDAGGTTSTTSAATTSSTTGTTGSTTAEPPTDGSTATTDPSESDGVATDVPTGKGTGSGTAGETDGTGQKGSGSGSTGSGSTGSTGDANMCAEIRMQATCFMTEGCTWDFGDGVGNGMCVPSDGMGICENIPVQVCETVPGCQVEDDACVPV